jgi:tetratricopeptide (TPR) repeat protein
MSRGPADDDDLSIEITPDIIEGGLESGPTDATATRPPGLSEAGDLDQRGEVDLYRSEAALVEPFRAAPLLHEAAHLQESGLGDPAAALASFQDALARDPTFLATWAPLRRLLSARGAWGDLVAVYERVIHAATARAFGAGAAENMPQVLGTGAALGTESRRRLADLWVERGRIQDDRLARPVEASASYHQATAAAPEHPTAHLARLIGAARAADTEELEAAMAGLIGCAAPARRIALAVELARAQRLVATDPPRSDPDDDAGGDTGKAIDPGGADRALETLRAALADRDAPEAGAPEPSPPTEIVAELEALARLRERPRAQAGALEELARGLPPEATAPRVALHRERARILRNVLHDLPAAHAALDEARRLMPEHPLLTTELLDVAEQLGSVELLGHTLQTSAIPQDEIQAAARLVDLLARSGRAGEALDLVRKYGDSWSADPASPTGLTALLSRIGLCAETGDAVGLADAFETEGARGQGAAAAHALVRAATLRDRVLHDPRHAEGLYRQALVRAPGYPPAVDALEEILRSDGRWAELAEILEQDLAVLPDDEATTGARRRYLLRALVTLHHDRLGHAARALLFQRQWVSLEPSDLDAWVFKRHLELAASLASAGSAPEVEARQESVATLIQLAARAGLPAVTAALENEAAALVTGDPSLAERFFRDAASDDRTGMAAGNLEPGFTSVVDRRKAIAAELVAAEAAGLMEAARGLRYRLALVRASAGEWKEAIAALVPLRAAGDSMARAWSFERARQSGDALLEVAVLGDGDGGAGAGGPEAGLGAPADLGEALERAGNNASAQIAYHESLRRGRSTDAGLGLLRTATAAGNLDGVTEALRAIGDMSFDDSGATVAAAARREADLLEALRAEGGGRAAPARARSPEAEAVAEDAIQEWIAGLRAGDQRRIADALIDLGAVASAGHAPEQQAPLLSRAAARARLAGRDAAVAVHQRAWAADVGNAAVAHGISDVRAAGAAAHLPDTRADRAAHLPASASGLATELDLERALEQEAGGSLGEALDVYGRILARDPDCLEAMLGVRRLARAGGDRVGEARALVRLGALVKTPVQAGALFAEAAPLYERAGRLDDAVAAYLKVLEHQPDHDTAFERLAVLLRNHPDAPGNAKTLDRILSHRLHRRGATAEPAEVIALLAERAGNRLGRLEDRESAAEDFKRILKIDPGDESALRQLATLAIAMQHPADAAQVLERYLVVATDTTRAAEARLDLAQAYEDAQDHPRAIDILRGAAAARPRDTVPLERMAALHVRAGDWRNAIHSLRAWEALVAEPSAKAALQLRIGTLLRDDAYDLPQAAVAFRCAAELDPLGDGTREMALLQESTGDEDGRVMVMEAAIYEMRRALQPDPFHVPRLRRLKELLDGAWRDGRGLEASRTVAQVLALLGDSTPEGEAPPATPPRTLSPSVSGEFWAALAEPAAMGFMTEVWLLLADGVLECHPADAAALGAVKHNRVAATDEPRLAWVVETAAVLGMPNVTLFRTARPNAREEEVVDAIELPAPGLAFGAAASASAGAAPFWFGRALGLLRYRATAVARLSAAELHTIFLAAGSIAGAASTTPETSASGLAVEVKTLSKALGRKERKALALQASRFGFERIDATNWQRAILRTADRLGLVLGGDVRAAVGALSGSADRASVAELRRDEAVVDLVRFAISDTYLALRQEAGADGL